MFNLKWIVENGYLVRFWKDNWLGEELMKTYSFAPKVLDFLNNKISIFISNWVWSIPHNFWTSYPIAVEEISSLLLPIVSIVDWGFRQLMHLALFLLSMPTSFFLRLYLPRFGDAVYGILLFNHAKVWCLGKFCIIEFFSDDLLQRRHVQLC